MTGFLLLLGHLVGDYILQNDWMARNKTNPHPGPVPQRLATTKAEYADENAQYVAWTARGRAWWLGHLACTIHCLLYTLSVWVFTASWMPTWGLAVCFLTHWPIDRFRLARGWMLLRLVHQREFATGPLAPWSVIVVDNISHLLTLAVIANLSGQV